MSKLSDRYRDAEKSGGKQINEDSYDIASELEGSLKSYFKLRRSVGWLGICLPILLIGFSLINKNGCEILPSISDYYHTSVNIIFIGILAAIASFMYYYDGDNTEKVLCKICAALAIIIVIAPTPLNELYILEPGAQISNVDFTSCYIPKFSDPPIVGQIHFIAATCFFLILAYLAGIKFRKRSIEKAEPPINQWIYGLCSFGMVIPMIIVGIHFFGSSKSPIEENESSLVLICEVIMLWSFGIAWLTKGDFSFRTISESLSN